MRRIGRISFALLLAVSVSAATGASQQPPVPPTAGSATCDEAQIDQESYTLTTEAQALNVLRPRSPWWEPYGIWQEPTEIGTLNQGAVRLAERAKELDERNLLAEGYLARQYVVMAVDADKAEASWQRVLDNGGAIVWTASLYEIDARSFFAVAFDRRGVRIFTFGQLAGELRTHFGVPDFPGSDRIEFWRALGGCLPANAVPEAEFTWADVRDLRVTKWMLRFELQNKVEITSDRGQRRADSRLEMALHGQTGAADFRFAMTPFPRPVGADPAAYQVRVRQMLLRFFDPDGRLGHAKRVS